jgi:hypothetical protein
MKHATNIYSVHFTGFFFLQMYASIPESRIEIKTANHNYGNAKSYREILLLSINDENSHMMCTFGSSGLHSVGYVNECQNKTMSLPAWCSGSNEGA